MGSKISRAAFTAVVLLPAPLDIRSNASVQLAIMSTDYVHKPSAGSHTEKCQMSDVEDNVSVQKALDLLEIYREFQAIAKANEWQAYHTPKNLASAVAAEAGELLAEFQWLTAEQSCQLGAEKMTKVADEIADVLMYLTALSIRLDINMAEAVYIKIAKNKIRFQQPPV